MGFRNGKRSWTRGTVAVASAVLLLAGGFGTSAGAESTDEPDVVVFHGLKASTGFEEFDGCPVIMGPDAAGPALCLRLDVGGPLNLGDVDADVDPPMTVIIGIRAGTSAGTFTDEIPPYVAVAPGEDGDPERVEGGLLGFEELAELLDPVDDVARDVAGAPAYNIDADADIADPDAQIDGLVELLAIFGDFAPFVGVDEGDVITVEDFYGLFGADAEELLGDQTILLPLSIQLRNLLLGDNCYIGTPDDRININLTTGTTDPPEGVEPMSGGYGSLMFEAPDEERPWDYINRILGAGFVDNTFAVPGASGCGAVDVGSHLPGGALPGPLNRVRSVLSPDQGPFDPVINQQAGLPSEAGNNVADFSIDFSVAWTNAVYQSLWTGTPTDIDFGEVLVGDSSAPETITIENTGDRPTSFGNPFVSGTGFGHFTFDAAGTEGNTCTGQILEVGDQCQVTVRATPLFSAGTRAGTLGFTASAATDGAGNATEPVTISVTAIE